MRKFIQSIISPNLDIPTQDALMYLLLLIGLIVGAGVVYYIVQGLIWVLYVMLVYPVETFAVTLFLLVLYVLGLKWMKQL